MKKRTKKTVLMILAIVLAVILLSLATVFAVKYAKKHIGTTTFSIENQTAIAGDTIKIPIEIVKNHGMWGGQIKINYDTNSLEFVSCANGVVFDECQASADSGSVIIIVNQSDLSESKLNGNVATLNFNIKQTASKGTYDIRFDSISNFADTDNNLLDVSLKNGTVTVK